MRRNVGGHTDRNTDRSVDQKVWKAAWQNGWLLGAAVVVVLKIDGLFVNVANHFHGQGRHAALGITRGSGWVVTRRSEVALTVYQRVAKVPVLNQANQGVVDSAVAVRVKLTHDIADNARALAELLVWSVAAVIHRIDNASVNWLETVANIWQRATNDDAHRVVEVASLHFDLKVDLLNVVVWCGGYFFVCHVFCPKYLESERL